MVQSDDSGEVGICIEEGLVPYLCLGADIAEEQRRVAPMDDGKDVLHHLYAEVTCPWEFFYGVGEYGVQGDPFLKV